MLDFSTWYVLHTLPERNDHDLSQAWTAPIQMIICLILLILNLGPSAIAGFGFFILATPVQTVVMKRLFALRQKSMAWTDKRAKLLQELLGGMKVIKFFAWEMPFLGRIFGYRQKEMACVLGPFTRVLLGLTIPIHRYIRSLLLIRSANNAVAMSMPVLASVIAFVTYSLTGHTLEPAVVFASLTLFNLLRLPLMFLRTYTPLHIPFIPPQLKILTNSTYPPSGVF